jgi:hypothetical protein
MSNDVNATWPARYQQTDYPRPNYPDRHARIGLAYPDSVADFPSPD